MFFSSIQTVDTEQAVPHKLLIVISHHTHNSDYKLIEHRFGFRVGSKFDGFCNDAILLDIYFDNEKEQFTIRGLKNFNSGVVTLVAPDTRYSQPMDIEAFTLFVNSFTADETLLFVEANLGKSNGEAVQQILPNCVSRIQPDYLFMFTSTEQCLPDVVNYIKSG